MMMQERRNLKQTIHRPVQFSYFYFVIGIFGKLTQLYLDFSFVIIFILYIEYSDCVSAINFVRRQKKPTNMLKYNHVADNLWIEAKTLETTRKNIWRWKFNSTNIIYVYKYEYHLLNSKGYTQHMPLIFRKSACVEIL